MTNPFWCPVPQLQTIVNLSRLKGVMTSDSASNCGTINAQIELGIESRGVLSQLDKCPGPVIAKPK